MPKKVKVFTAGLFLAIIGIACFALGLNSSRAETDIFGLDGPFDGDGWSLSADKTLTIESDQGWWNAMKHGFSAHVNKLIIGKDVTEFRLYFLPDEVPSPEFFDDVEAAGYDKNGEPYYDYFGTAEIYPQVIQVEAGNPVFYVTNGLLINKATSELVLSEMGVTDVVIPEGVKEITREAFSERLIQSVKFPSTLEVIGLSAFEKCVDLKTISFPESLRELKAGAFSGCIDLQEVSLPSKLKVLGAGAFSRCPIQYIEIPEQVDEIGADAFFGCNQLQQVILPEGLKKIRSGAFSGCEQLFRIDLPEGLESIGSRTFYDCHQLKQVILPNTLGEIGDRAFWGCNLSVFRIPAKLVFPVYNFKLDKFVINPYSKKDKSFSLHSVDTVILSGSDYDFGYPAISNAKNVYFLGKPPEDVGQILDEDSVEKIYCSDEFEFEWTRSTVASWVRQRLTMLPADQINDWAETTINTTPVPTNTPSPTPSQSPTPTSWPTPMPRPTASPAVNAEKEQKPIDPILLVFAGVLALVVAGIVVVALKTKIAKKHPRKKK